MLKICEERGAIFTKPGAKARELMSVADVVMYYMTKRRMLAMTRRDSRRQACLACFLFVSFITEISCKPAKVVPNVEL